MNYSAASRPALAAFVFALLSLPAFAQAPAALPTAPGADRAGDNGMTAGASLPGDGLHSSPLEPWLVVWLIPVAGILAGITCVSADRRLRVARR